MPQQPLNPLPHPPGQQELPRVLQQPLNPHHTHLASRNSPVCCSSSASASSEPCMDSAEGSAPVRWSRFMPRMVCSNSL